MKEVRKEYEKSYSFVTFEYQKSRIQQSAILLLLSSFYWKVTSIKQNKAVSTNRGHMT